MYDEPFPDNPASIAVQSVLYHTPYDTIVRTLEALDNAAEIGFRELFCSSFEVVLGDASPTRCLSDQQLDDLRSLFPHVKRLTYHFFNKNVGTSRGHNHLATLSTGDFIITSNPDVVPEPRAIWRMLTVMNDAKVGMVEAKQLPIEHPKDYQATSGFTSWATTAFAMTRRTLFDKLEGFDEQTFFMYCDDVDYSWRVREAGFSVVFHPAAVVFHDKSLTLDGKWMPTDAERRFSAEAALLLAHKWSRDAIVEKLLDAFSASDQPHHGAARKEFLRRKRAGTLVPQRDPKHKVATFVGSFYEKHRFPL